MTWLFKKDAPIKYSILDRKVLHIVFENIEVESRDVRI